MSNSGSGRYACSSQRSVTDDRIPDRGAIFAALREHGLAIAWADE